MHGVRMRVGLCLPPELPESFLVVAGNIVRELKKLDCEIHEFADPASPPQQVDVLWDPRAGGGSPPLAPLCGRAVPLVVTLHGAAPMAIPLYQYHSSVRAMLRGFRANRRKRRAWAELRDDYAAVVTVSKSSRASILRALPIPPDKITWCYNAVDHSVFTVRDDAGVDAGRGYFLHISNDEPRKNVDRIIRAHAMLPAATRPRLLLKLPGSTARAGRNDVEIISGRLSDGDLAALYGNARAFVFPSLFEGFGIPIVEAMACGCPVITANQFACAEVAGDAALLVDPRSTRALKQAMETVTDPSNVVALKTRGLERARDFTWRAAAEHYLKVFTSVAD